MGGPCDRCHELKRPCCPEYAKGFWDFYKPVKEVRKVRRTVPREIIRGEGGIDDTWLHKDLFDEES